MEMSRRECKGGKVRLHTRYCGGKDDTYSIDIVKFNVQDDKITVNIGELALKGTYTVDETKKPKTLDIKFDGGVGAIGIHEMVDDNKVKFCIVDSDKNKERPTKFESTAGSGT